MLRESLKSFVQAEVEPQALEYDRKGTFNLPLFRKLGDLGFAGDHCARSLRWIRNGCHGCGDCAWRAQRFRILDFAWAYLAHSMLCVNNLPWMAVKRAKEEILATALFRRMGWSYGHERRPQWEPMCWEWQQQRFEGDHYILNGRRCGSPTGLLMNRGTPCELVWVYAKRVSRLQEGAMISTFIVEKRMAGFSGGKNTR